MSSIMAEEKHTCVVICATVTTGFESVTKDECRQKLKGTIVKEVRGKIHFKIPVTELNNLDKLRSVENLSIIVKEFESFDCHSDDVLKRIEKLPEDFSWNYALRLWQQYTGYKDDPVKSNESEDSNNGASSDVVCAVNEKSIENGQNISEESDTKRQKICFRHETNFETTTEMDRNTELCPSLCEVEEPFTINPSFRVTCSRSSIKRGKHSFTSMEAASQFGSGVNKSFGWRVDLKNADIEVLLRIVDDELSVGLALTRVTRGRRNIAHFGPTTLKSTLAYSLLHLADIHPGDVVCDPMCGGGSIPLEGALNWSSCVHLCGDNHDLAPPRVLSNVQEIVKESEQKMPLLDIYQWDVCNLPLKDNSVDVIVTDLPFGKKSGSKQKNWELYPKALVEMARVCPTSTGRAVLLTQDKKVMSKVLGANPLWRKKLTLWINMGGLSAGVYILHRTSKNFQLSCEGQKAI